LRHPQKLAGLLCLSGYVPLHAAIGAERHAANQHTPIFMAHGQSDPVIPIRRAEQSRDLLQLLGYAVEWHTYAMPHSVCPDEIDDISRWLQKLYRRQNS
jgi:phospholipase/carboxylesterase